MTLYVELVPGTAAGGLFHLNSGQAVPDRANNRIAAFQYKYPGPFATYLELFNYTTGARLSETAFTAVAVVSGNDTTTDRGMCLGADGFLYVVSSTYAADKTAARVSKINLNTPVEVAAVHPTLFVNVGNFASTNDFYLIPFQSGGVQYLALIQESSSATNIEIINAATMASVATGIYPNSGDRIIPCPGGANAGEVYILTTNFGAPTNCHLDKIVYTVGGGLVMTTVATLAPTDFVATWTDINDTGSMIYDSVNGNLCVWVQGDDPDIGSAGYLFKINKATGAIVWRGYDQNLTDYFSGTNLQNSELAGGLFSNINVSNSVTLINLSDGSAGPQVFNQHSTFDYTCQVWNGGNNTLIVNDKGDLSGAAQWGILSYTAMLASPHIIVSQGGFDPHAFPDPQTPDHMYVLRQTPEVNGYWMQKRRTTDNAVLQSGPKYLSAGDLGALGGGLAGPQFYLNSNMSGPWTDDDHLYVTVYNNPTSGHYNTKLIQLLRSTLSVNQAFSGTSYDTTNAAFTYTRGSYLVASMNGTWVARFTDDKVHNNVPLGSTTFVASYVELWNTTNTDHSYVDLSSIGVTGLVTAGVFDAAGFLWMIEQPRDPTGVIGQHKYAQSILRKLSVAGSPTPALTLVSSVTIPDNYYALGSNVDFDATFNYYYVTYQQADDSIYLWANYTNFATNDNTQGWFRQYHVGSATLDAAADYTPGSRYIGNSFDKVGWTQQRHFVTYEELLGYSSNAELSIFYSSDNSITDYTVNTVWTNFEQNVEYNNLFYNEGAKAVTAFGNTFQLDAVNAATDAVFVTSVPVSDLDVPLVGVEAHGEVAQFGVTSPLPSGMLPDVLPSVLYQEYNDDDDMHAFVSAYNVFAQAFVDWFNGLHLPIYTQDPISGDLLDWVARGLYGLARPALSLVKFHGIGPFNTYWFNQLGLNTLRRIGPEDAIAVTDDVFRRVLTWHIEKGYGKAFNIRWLKRRIMQFLLGVDGVPFNVDQTYPISVTFGVGNQVNINFLKGQRRVLGGAIFNRFGFNVKYYNELDTDFIAFPGIINAALLKAAIDSGVLELPFQFTYVVNVE